jgi:alanyl-tRNA synthetase
VKPTVVDFPAGVVHGSGTVVGIVEGNGVIVDRTPFHPVDPTWPDQPTDLGTLNGQPVVECQLGAVSADGSIAVGAAIDARRGDPDYAWVVVHHVQGQVPATGEVVDLVVDADRRAALSRAHTACHVLALALNKVLAPAWRKDVVRDGIGNPDFDRLALTESLMTPDEARDTYRLGKSLRKKGFDPQFLLSDLPGIAAQVNGVVQGWIEADASVTIEAEGPNLTDMRYWCCEVPEGVFRIPCGGTHVTSLRELGAVTVHYEQPDEATVVAVTEVSPQA